MPDQVSNLILLYDGVCGLCNRLNQFLLKRDVHDRLRFASLQSDFAISLLRRHGINLADLDTVYVVDNQGQPNEKLFARSDAILRVLRELGGIWSISRLGKVVPKWLRDRVYDVVAQNRYRVFGKYETCLIPSDEYRHKFLDQA
ncbi:MAG: thiol-disulfide oxidoreductase DCC family protein [Pyrinomonadaceae bacterium]